MMDPAEIDAIMATLKPDTVMLEWGSGGSTLHWSKHVKKLHSIEHIAIWRDQVERACREACPNSDCPNLNLNLSLSLSLGLSLKLSATLPGGQPHKCGDSLPPS